jgi:uncharacterized membrane protein
MGGAVAVHVAGGLSAIVCGTIALSVRKGARLHRRFGTAFFVAMLTMAAVGAAMAVVLGQDSNVVGGVCTFYLVVSAWLVVLRRPGQVGRAEIVALCGGMAVALGVLALGVNAMAHPDAAPNAPDPDIFFVFGTVILLAAALDARVVWRGGIAGRPRIVRHVWRVCLGLFVATGSFFLGQQQVMPVAIQGSPLLFVPAFAPLAVLVFWLARLWGTGWVLRPANA